MSHAAHPTTSCKGFLCCREPPLLLPPSPLQPNPTRPVWSGVLRQDELKNAAYFTQMLLTASTLHNKNILVVYSIFVSELILNVYTV